MLIRPSQKDKAEGESRPLLAGIVAGPARRFPGSTPVCGLRPGGLGPARFGTQRFSGVVGQRPLGLEPALPFRAAAASGRSSTAAIASTGPVPRLVLMPPPRSPP
jgi:hypothetical protein